jgi:cytidylate kinase|tara:strand:+ start:2250 stop:2921 length:672 start_codon:yes stop_codon:yes gene_type:complete
MTKVVTIDGPSGVGKGTISEYLSDKLAWNYLNSGALYRAIAWVVKNDSIRLSDITTLENASKNIHFTIQENKLHIEYENKEISSLIYNEEVAKVASKVSSVPKVRESILSIQRSFKKEPGLIAEGRDMGSVIFPEAQVKIFLTASIETRAQRRFKQLKDRKFNVSLPALIKDLDARDKRDESRESSPLVIPEGAFVIETDDLNVIEVKNIVKDKVNKTYGTNI